MQGMIYFGGILKPGMMKLRLADGVKRADFLNPMGSLEPWILDDVRLEYRTGPERYAVRIKEVESLCRTGRLTIMKDRTLLLSEDFLRIPIGASLPKLAAGGLNLNPLNIVGDREIPRDAALTIDIDFLELPALEGDVQVKVYLISKEVSNNLP